MQWNGQLKNIKSTRIHLQYLHTWVIFLSTLYWYSCYHSNLDIFLCFQMLSASRMVTFLVQSHEAGESATNSGTRIFTSITYQVLCTQHQDVKCKGKKNQKWRCGLATMTLTVNRIFVNTEGKDIGLLVAQNPAEYLQSCHYGSSVHVYGCRCVDERMCERKKQWYKSDIILVLA